MALPDEDEFDVIKEYKYKRNLTPAEEALIEDAQGYQRNLTPAEKAMIDAANKEKMTRRNSNFFKAMKNSLFGIWTIIIRERNMRIHILLSFLILAMGIYLELSRSDWLWVTVGVFTVITSEFVNTIIETLVDLVVEKHFHPLAKIAKDVAAGGVLVAVMFEIIVLAIILQPYIWQALGLPPLHFFDRSI